MSAAEPTRVAPSLAVNPFWKLNVGWWRSENTYFDGQLNYNIRSYASLLHIEIAGDILRQTEYKFYAPGRLALGAGRGLAGPDEGVEVDTVTLAEAVDALGTVRVTRMSPKGPPGDTTIAVLTPDTAVSVTRERQGIADDYRMFITLPAADKRYAANFGIIDGAGTDPDPAHAGGVGDLRGFSLFRQTRVLEQDIAGLRRELRRRFNVQALVTGGDDDAPRVERLP